MMNIKSSIYNDDIRFFVTPAGSQREAVANTELSRGTEQVRPPYYDRARQLLGEAAQVGGKIDTVTPEWTRPGAAAGIESVVDTSKRAGLAKACLDEVFLLPRLNTQLATATADLTTATALPAADPNRQNHIDNVNQSIRNLTAQINTTQSATDTTAMEAGMMLFEDAGAETYNENDFVGLLQGQLEHAIAIKFYREKNPGDTRTDKELIISNAPDTYFRSNPTPEFDDAISAYQAIFHGTDRSKNLFQKTRTEFMNRRLKKTQEMVQRGKISLDEAKKQIGFELADKLSPAKVDEEDVAKAVDTYHDALREPNGALKAETVGDLDALLAKVAEMGKIDPATMFQLEGTLAKLRNLGKDDSTEVEAQMVSKALQSYETTMARTAKEYEVVALDLTWKRLFGTLKDIPKHFKTAMIVIGVVGAPWLAASLLSATAAGASIAAIAGLATGVEAYAAIKGYDYLKKKRDVGRLKEQEEVDKEQLKLMVAYKNAKDGLEGTGKEWVKAIEEVKLELKRQIFKGMEPVSVTEKMLDDAIAPYLPKQKTDTLQTKVSNLAPKVT